jgi:hypothetical protein
VPQVSRWAKLPAAIALAASAAVASAQGLDSLPEDQQLGFCATFYMAEQQATGAEESPLAAAFLMLAANISEQEIEALAEKLQPAADMLIETFQKQAESMTSQMMIDFSRSFCEGITENYDETRGLLE